MAGPRIAHEKIAAVSELCHHHSSFAVTKEVERMGDLVKVALISDLEPGQGKTVERRGVAVALFNVDGTFRAIGNACCHRGGPLAEGELTGTTVTCPWHGWQFNVTTGSTLRNSEIAVPAYRVEVRGDAVFVELP